MSEVTDRVALAGEEICAVLRAGTLLHAEGDRLKVENRWGTRDLAVGSSHVAAAMESLAQPQSIVELSQALMGACGAAGVQEVSRLHLIVAAFGKQGLLDWVVTGPQGSARLTGEGTLPVVVRTAPQGPLRLRPAVVAQPATSSDGPSGLVVLLHADSHRRLVTDPAIAAHVFAQHVEKGADAGLSKAIDLAWSADLLESVSADPDDADRLWSVPERWLHSRTQQPHGVTWYGGTYPMLDRIAPPAFNESVGEPAVVIDLPEVDPFDDAAAHISLGDAMERRRSVRDFDGDRSPTIEQLSQLLFRTVRARAVFTAEHGLEVADKPVPAGGSIHEIDTYLLIDRCVGVAPGLWRYDCVGHRLELVTAEAGVTDPFRREVRDLYRSPQDPPVAIVLAARFERINFKYQTIGYSLALKHAGVVTEAMYLTATALGLGTCGLGGGLLGVFATVTGLDPRRVGPVAALILGVPA